VVVPDVDTPGLTDLCEAQLGGGGQREEEKG